MEGSGIKSCHEIRKKNCCYSEYFKKETPKNAVKFNLSTDLSFLQVECQIILKNRAEFQ